MSVLAPAKGRPLVVGANHRSSSLALRDALFVEDPLVPRFLEKLRGKGFEQAQILSTCDRVEIQAIDPTGENSAQKIMEVMAEQAGVSTSNLSGEVYQFHGDEAIRHIFAVASSLDSLIIGEPQVLGQVKDSHKLSKENNMIGTEMETLLQAAYATAKRVRTETKIGEGPVSIASATIQIAKNLHGDLSRCVALLVGGGEMGELAGDALKLANIGKLSVTHPTLPRAESLARKLECHVVEFEDLNEAIAEADIVLTSLNKRRQVVTFEMIKDAIKKRKRKPIFLVDTGIPGDVDPSIVKLDAAFLYDLNDLEKVAMEGRASREGEAKVANEILATETSNFVKGRAARVAIPALTSLRDYFEMERQAVLDSVDGNRQADEATRLLVNRLLHNPSEIMRQMASQKNQGNKPSSIEGDWDQTEKIIKHLFRLDGGDTK
ncbi:MAG: glutamyl-tRNA reductase [Rhodospirillales bacterium]|nr:glutamyl-tRNA reductase [Rhodospirillales bacterium]